MQIGPYKLTSNIFLAPMAGVSDRPFREIAHEYGVGLATSEMLSANPLLAHTRKSRLRRDFRGEPGVRSVQIVGTEPDEMAAAAIANVDRGAEIIDINMGCPAKKVCSKLAGSALLRDERLVSEILNRVVKAVEVPVTLKIRTGWSLAHRNGVSIARIAEEAGIVALAVHGRTRACAFRGHAEYDTIARIKQSVGIPVIANGDIDTPSKAREVMAYTGADGVMIGRAAQGKPDLLLAVQHYMLTGNILPSMQVWQLADIMLRHLGRMHEFYGEYAGVRIARKHMSWYCKRLQFGERLRSGLLRAERATQQFDLLNQYLEDHDDINMRLAA